MSRRSKVRKFSFFRFVFLLGILVHFPKMLIMLIMPCIVNAEHCAKFAKAKDSGSQDDEAASDDEGDSDSEDDNKNCISSDDEMDVEGI